jgi:hypothetical protein
VIPLCGTITARVPFLCFCRAKIRGARVRSVVYDHLTLPIRRISRFRHGAEVLSKELAQVGIK